MTTFPRSPCLLKWGIVSIDPEISAVQRIILLLYNPETLSRTLQVRGVGTEGGDSSEASRLKGPPIETNAISQIYEKDWDEVPNQYSDYRM